MSNESQELFKIASSLETIALAASEPEVAGPIEALEDASTTVGNAWSGSWLGYFSRIYYDGLQPPPAGAAFNQEYGFIQMISIRTTTGDWKEYSFEEVKTAVLRRAGTPDLTPAEDLAKQAVSEFGKGKSDISSILAALPQPSVDRFLERIRTQIEELTIETYDQIINRLKPTEAYSRDSTAVSQGFHVPPHLSVFADARALANSFTACRKLVELARQAASHIARLEERSVKDERVGTNVFIGHGQSAAWRELKDFIHERLGLPYDEFNRVPVAGVTNIARLSEMLDGAAIAFLVLTGEDEQSDGQLHARMNVVHEAGLFQGRLGFERAIIVLEEGCEEFSNIEGLGQIRFPTGNISAAFEDIRRVLEREELIAFHDN